MSLGFEQAGFHVVAGVDFDSINIESYRKNFPKSKAILGNLAKLTGKEIRALAGIGNQKIDVVFGGPPCGGFSLIGKRKPNDSRNKLIFHFVRLVKELKPDYFVFENVRGLAIGRTKKKLKAFLKQIKASGYETVEPVQILNDKNYGVPQDRQRLIILGRRKKAAPLKYPNGTGMIVNVWDAIGDLPNIENKAYLFEQNSYLGNLKKPSNYAKLMRGVVRDKSNHSYKRTLNGLGLTGFKRSRHSKDTIRRFLETKQGNSEVVSRLYKLSKNGVARTLRAGADRDHGSYTAPRPIHPVYPRCITIREGARLHSFPDWFQFDETIWHGFRQIGNSVPPLLVRAIAVSLLCAIRHGGNPS